MPRDMIITSPDVNDAFLDRIVQAAASASDVVRGLTGLSGDARQQLLGADVVNARKAASELVHNYFGLDYE